MATAVLGMALLIGPATPALSDYPFVPTVSSHAQDLFAAKSDPDQTGMAPSAYRGEYFRASQESVRRCIGQREGRFQYWGTGSNRRYQGTYQVTDALAVGAAWMMRRELRRDYGRTVGNEISRQLRLTPAHKWSRYFQDALWFTVANWNGDGSGLKHWANGRWSCAS